MPRLGPIKREDFVRKLRLLGFEGPFPAKRHAFMQYRDYSLHIPRYEEYSKEKHREMLREVEHVVGHAISRDEWLRL
jgi:hypothetical protein